jgi:hypothetical protein
MAAPAQLRVILVHLRNDLSRVKPRHGVPGEMKRVQCGSSKLENVSLTTGRRIAPLTICVSSLVDGKERSYRSLATFLDSDENFMLYRRFGYLHSRMLLRLQDKLRKLESQLDDYDDEDAGEEGNPRLLMILDETEQVLEKYGKYLCNKMQNQRSQFSDNWVLKAQNMAALNRPAERDYRSVEAYIFEKKPLFDEEYGFIYNKEDLITLRDGRETTFLDNLTEKMLQTFHCSLLQVNSTLLVA